MHAQSSITYTTLEVKIKKLASPKRKQLKQKLRKLHLLFKTDYRVSVIYLFILQDRRNVTQLGTGKVNLPIVSIFAVAVGVGNEDVLLDDGDDGSSKSTPRQRTP